MFLSRYVFMALSTLLAFGAESALAVDHVCPTSFSGTWGYTHTFPAFPGTQTLTFTKAQSHVFQYYNFNQSTGVFQCASQSLGSFTSPAWDPDQSPAVGTCSWKSFKIASAPGGFTRDWDPVVLIRNNTTGSGETKRCTATVDVPSNMLGFLIVKKTLSTNCRAVGGFPNGFVRCP